MSKHEIQIAEEIEIHPYVRMTQRSKWINKYAIAYMNNQKLFKETLIYSMNRYIQNPVPRHTPFQIKIHITQTRALHRCDLDNQIKAILDGCQGILFPNDFWCDSIQATRSQSAQPFLQIWIDYEVKDE